MNRLGFPTARLSVYLLLISAIASCYSTGTQSQPGSPPLTTTPKNDLNTPPVDMGQSTFLTNALPQIIFTEGPGRFDIQIGSQFIGSYVYDDPVIPRPYFCQIKTLQGVQITRPNPPDPVVNKGNDDHATFHPGVWLAFGDLSGSDFWRNKARIHHIRFIESPMDGQGAGQFSVENEYCSEAGSIVCREVCSYRIICQTTNAFFLTSHSIFQSDNSEFAFGDQEEMGVGVRLNTPLTVKYGTGSLLNSDGGEDEKGTWGRPAQWCAAVGSINGQPAGIVLIPSPENYRTSWFHTRDYGLIVANPFGRKAMTAPEDPSVKPDSTNVKRGTPFVFGWGLYVWDGDTNKDINVNRAYKDYLKLIGR